MGEKMKCLECLKSADAGRIKVVVRRPDNNDDTITKKSADNRRAQRYKEGET